MPNLAIGLNMFAASPVVVFDPATLSLSGWWRGSFAGSPWVGSASAGSSGSRNLSQGVVPPTVGTAQNGRTPATFNGTTQHIDSAVNNNVLLGANGSVWCLFKPASTPAKNVTDYANGNLFTDNTNGETTFGYTSDGCSACVYDGAFKYHHIVTGDLTGAYHLVQWKYDGANLRGRVDSGSWSQLACGSPSFLVPGTMFAGEGYAGLVWLTGDILEIGCSTTTISDADYDKIKSYVNARYALSL